MSRRSLSKLNESNPMWKGDMVGYGGLHDWIKRRLPKPELCQICNKVPPQDLANISGMYLRDLSDWQWLCRSCHMKSDGRMKNLDTTGRPSWKKGIFIDMSGRICSICGSNKTYIPRNTGRPYWYHLDNQLMCKRCYGRESYRKRKRSHKPALFI